MRNLMREQKYQIVERYKCPCGESGVFAADKISIMGISASQYLAWSEERAVHMKHIFNYEVGKLMRSVA